MFGPGNNANPKGRPVGSKDKGHLTANYWVLKAQDEWQHLKPYERAVIATKLACAFITKQSLHLTPEQSVEHAAVAFEMLKRMEGNFAKVADNRGNTGSDPVRLADRAIEVQAITPPDRSV